jgi:hypothetical protein
VYKKTIRISLVSFFIAERCQEAFERYSGALDVFEMMENFSKRTQLE